MKMTEYPSIFSYINSYFSSSSSNSNSDSYSFSSQLSSPNSSPIPSPSSPSTFLLKELKNEEEIKENIIEDIKEKKKEEDHPIKFKRKSYSFSSLPQLSSSISNLHPTSSSSSSSSSSFSLNRPSTAFSLASSNNCWMRQSLFGIVLLTLLLFSFLLLLYPSFILPSSSSTSVPSLSTFSSYTNTSSSSNIYSSHNRHSSSYSATLLYPFLSPLSYINSFLPSSIFSSLFSNFSPSTTTSTPSKFKTENFHELLLNKIEILESSDKSIILSKERLKNLSRLGENYYNSSSISLEFCKDVYDYIDYYPTKFNESSNFKPDPSTSFIASQFRNFAYANSFFSFLFNSSSTSLPQNFQNTTHKVPLLIYSMPNSGEILTRILLEYGTGYHTTTVNPSPLLYSDFKAEKQCNLKSVAISSYPNSNLSLSFNEGTLSSLKSSCSLSEKDQIEKVLMINRNPFFSIAFDYYMRMLNKDGEEFEARKEKKKIEKKLGINDLNKSNNTTKNLLKKIIENKKNALYNPLEFLFYSLSMVRLYKKLWNKDFMELSALYKDKLLVLKVEDFSENGIKINLLDHLLKFLNKQTINKNQRRSKIFNKIRGKNEESTKINDKLNYKQLKNNFAIVFSEDETKKVEQLYRNNLKKNKTLPFFNHLIQKDKIIEIDMEENINDEVVDAREEEKEEEEKEIENMNDEDEIVNDYIEPERYHCAHLLAESKKKNMKYFNQIYSKNHKSFLYSYYPPKLFCLIRRYLRKELEEYNYIEDINKYYDCSKEDDEEEKYYKVEEDEEDVKVKIDVRDENIRKRENKQYIEKLKEEKELKLKNKRRKRRDDEESKIISSIPISYDPKVVRRFYIENYDDIKNKFERYVQY